MASTRAQVRAAITAKVVSALPGWAIIEDPAKGAMFLTGSHGPVAQVVWRRVDYTDNRLLGAHDQAEAWTWEVQLLVPGEAVAAQGVAEEAFEAVFDTLCPAAGWKPNATGEYDCDNMNVVSEEYVGDTDGGRRLYIATYQHNRQK